MFARILRAYPGVCAAHALTCTYTLGYMCAVVDDEWNPDADLEETPPDAPMPATPAVTPGTRKSITLAEQLADAVRGVKQEAKPLHTCSCGGTRWKRISLADGSTLKQCKQCRLRVPWSTSSFPRYTPTGQTPAAADPNLPKFKR